MRWLVVLVGLALVGCSDPGEAPPAGTATPEEATYLEFEDVDVQTSEFFIALEGDDFAAARASNGETRLWNVAVGRREAIDDGSDVEDEIGWLTDAGFSEGDAGQLLGAAVIGVRPAHRDAARAWVDAQG